MGSSRKVFTLAWRATWLLLVAAVFFALYSHRALAAGPSLINFQGKVVNADGTNVTNGSYNFDFVLYDDASLGSPSDGVHDKWHELSKSVTVTNGVFQTNLGSATALPNFNTNNSLYLAIRFNSDAAGYMSPRVQMTSAPYALNADMVGGLTTSSLARVDASNTFASSNIFNGALTFNTDSDFVFSGTENLTVTSDLAGTVDVMSLIATPSSSAGTTQGLFIQQANSANTNGLDTGIVIDNADTNLAISTGLALSNSGGGGYTSGLTITGATTDITTTGNEALTISAAGSGDVILSTDADTNVQFTETSAPTVDMVAISNAGFATVTDTVDGLQMDFVVGNPGGAINNSAIKINVTSGSTVASSTLQGIDIATLTTPQANTTEAAIRIGTGWDSSILGSGALTINSAAANNIALDSAGAGTAAINLGANNATSVVLGRSGQTVQIKAGTPATNGIAYSSDSNGTINFTATGGGGTLCLVSTAGGTPVFSACSGSTSTSWSSLSAASTNLTLANGTNTSTFSATGLTTQTAYTHTGGSAMTTGTVLAVNGTTYTHGAAETGSLVGLAFSDTTSAAFATTTNGLLITPTVNTTGANARTFNGLSVAAPPTFSCGAAGGTCTYNSLDANTATLTQITTNTFNINGLNLGTAGALTQNTAAGTINWKGLNINTPNITQTTGTINADGLSIAIGTIAAGGRQNGLEFGSIAAPTAGSTAGLYFSDIDWADLHSTTATNNNLANIVIKQSSAGTNANTFTIKNDASTMLSLFELRDLTANTAAFGGLAISGGFVSTQSYFGEEFNIPKVVVGTGCSDSTVAATTNTAERRGDATPGPQSSGGAAVTGCSAGSGELLTSSDGSGTASGTCVYSSVTPGSTANGGIERIAATGAATPRNTMCLETNSTTVAGTQYGIFNTANLPQVVMKVRPSQVGSSNFPIYVGLSNRATADATTSGMLNTNIGFYFTNCSQPVTPTCTTSGWTGVVADGTTNPPNTVTGCQGTAISATNFSYLRIETRKATTTSNAVEVQFFADFNTSDGISEISCGTITTTTNNFAAASNSMGILLAAGSNTVATAQNLDTDYFRVWQDDAPAFPTSPSDNISDTSSDTVSTPPDTAAGLTTPPLTPDSSDPEVVSTLFDFNAATSEDTVFNKNVYVHGTLYADKIKANQIEGLEVLTDKINSRSSQQTGQSGSNTSSASGLSAVIGLDNIAAKTASISQGLTVNGVLVANGGLNVGSQANFADTADFQKTVNFWDNVVFNSDISFLGRTTFNNDSGGFATIKAGQTSVNVYFDKSYKDPPVISLSIKNGQFANYSYNGITDNNNNNTGFTILLQNPAVNDIEFAWTAFNIKDAKTVQSVSN